MAGAFFVPNEFVQQLEIIGIAILDDGNFRFGDTGELLYAGAIAIFCTSY